MENELPFVIYLNKCIILCRTILKNNLHLYPHRMTSVPELLVDDPAQRLQFGE
jgi:hypothetical protein